MKRRSVFSAKGSVGDWVWKWSCRSSPGLCLSKSQPPIQSAPISCLSSPGRALGLPSPHRKYRTDHLLIPQLETLKFTKIASKMITTMPDLGTISLVLGISAIVLRNSDPTLGLLQDVVDAGGEGDELLPLLVLGRRFVGVLAAVSLLVLPPTMSEYQRYNREDPRLNRQSPKESASNKSPPRDPRTRTPSNSSNWEAQNNHGNQFGQPQPIQTAYQHLQPNNVYNNSNQYPNQGYYGGYGNYNYNAYQYPNQASQPYIAGVGQPGPPGDEYPQSGWAPVQNYENQNANNPATEFKQNNSSLDNTKSSKSEGVAEEVIKQKASLLKERETYEGRVASLGKKLKILVEQKEQLQGKRSPDRETLHIIKENTKLQVEIQSKIKDANNVIEILSGLIGDKRRRDEEAEPAGADPEPGKKDDRVNYKHYDPEIHWCRMCDVFPQSAKELLVHLHSKKHQQIAQEEIPWHKLPPEPKYPVYDSAPVRRLPIKGLQFFVASTAWYCRLCDAWIGDLHCASQHLMSLTHSQNYSNFVEQNPHWEIEWLKDREKALERIKRSKASSDSEDKKKRRRKDKYSPSSLLSKDKKKKKRRKKRKHSSDSSSSSSSSSSSEDEDKSKSIRVAMRNKIKLLSEKEDKLDILGKLVEEERRRQEKLAETKPKTEDNLMSQWMTVSEPPDKEKQLMDSLKEKLKQKQDNEKAKQSAERESARRTKEKEEYEMRVREKERQEALAREEEDKKRDKMSLKLKDQVKISKRDSYRRRSSSRSPSKHRRSPSPDRRKYERNGSQRSFDRSPHMRYGKDEDKPDKKSRKLPFIAKMPLFKNQKLKKPEDDRKEKEIQKEDYDIPRKTRFQPGNLARAFIPEPEVVCFPKLSSYPPIAPPPPAIVTPPAVITPPAPPTILPKPPPPPKLDQPELEKADETDYNALYEENYNYGPAHF